VPGGGHAGQGAPVRRAHRLSMSVSVTTAKASPTATTVAMSAPLTTAITVLATIAQIRRHSGVPWCGGTGASTTGSPSPRRRRGGGPSASRRDRRRARAGRAVALAGLRHPVAISETIASPTTQAEAVVSSVIDTQPQMVPTPPVELRAPGRLHRAWAVPLAVVSFGLLLVVLAASLLPADLAAENEDGVEAPYALVPADAEPVAPRIGFDAVPRYDAQGELLFVTVRQPEVTLLDWFVGDDLSEVRFLSTEERFGVQTPEQQRQVNVQLMRSAKETAEYVALEKLGYPVELVRGEVIVSELSCLEVDDAGTRCVEFAPSDAVLDPGDRLIEVDGVELEVLDDLAPILARHEPGDEIDIVYERPGEGRGTGRVELIAANDGTDRTIIGFLPFDTAQARVPFDIGIDSGAIGGPSAGLAFTLTLIDELTDGELTGGRTVAVTGAIRIDGGVGAIGGLVAKTSAVKQRGADLFIVPSAQGEEELAAARTVAGDDLEIVAVDDLDGALQALAERGGNGLELGRPGEGFEPER